MSNARSRLPVVLRALVGVALVANVIMFAWVVLGRFAFPFEIEFMTGSVLDHVERVMHHEPVYVAPSAGFIPYLYPPLYYWICGALGGSVMACRGVSLVATLVQLGAAYRIALALGASRRWALGAGALFLACFPYVGYWYDLERCDSLLGGLVLSAALVLVLRPGVAAHAVAGALLGAAFLAKQQAIFYIAGAGVGLLCTRRSREPAPWTAIVAFSIAAAGTGGALAALAYHRESAWFVYYVFRMPPSHGLMPFLVVEAMLPDLVMGFALVLGTVFLAVHAVLALRKGEASRPELVFAGMLAAGFAGAMSSRLHIGGHVNVLIPWTTFASIAVIVVVSRHAASRWAPVAHALLLGQLALWAYHPGKNVPARAAATRNERFPALVREIEKTGPVLIPSRGHVTTPRRFQIAALADVVRVDGESPSELVSAIAERRFAAIIDDARPRGETPSKKWPPVLLEDVADLHDPLLRSYYVAEWVNDDIIETQLPSPALPHWIYRPRRTPLDLDGDALRERQLREMKLALARSLDVLRGNEPGFAAEDIELLAGH